MFLSWKSLLQICLLLVALALVGLYWFVNLKAQEARLAFLSTQLEYSQSVDRLNAAVQSNTDALLERLLSETPEVCLPDATLVIQEVLNVEFELLSMQQAARDAYRYESALPLSDVRLLMQYTNILSSIADLLEATRSIRDVYQEDANVCFRRTPPGVPA